MKRKPFAINFIAACFLLAPIFNILITAWFNHWPMSGPRGVVEHFNTYEWAVLLCYPLVALGIWVVKKWGYYLFVSFSILIICHNFYVFMANKQYSSYLVLLFQVTTLIVLGIFLQGAISAPYFNPKLKWWESLPRFKSEIKGKGQHGEKTFDVEFLDISRGGCFIKTTETLKTAQVVYLEFWFNEDLFSAKGKVMWTNKKEPTGFGIKFKRLQLRDKWALARILDQLKGKKKKKKFNQVRAA